MSSAGLTSLLQQVAQASTGPGTPRMNGVDRHASRLGKHIRVTTRQIDGADRIGLIRWQAVNQR